MTSNVSQRQGFTLIELLVVIAIISIIAGLVVPSLIRVRREAQKAECSHNLQQVYAFALAYSDGGGSNAFPIGSGRAPRAHDSINVLLASDEAEGLVPKLFVCPAGDAHLASFDEDGRFLLDEETCGIAWTARKLKSTAMNKPLASDKYVDGYEDEWGIHNGHSGMNVLMTDGSVQFTKVSALPSDTMLPAGLAR